MSKKQIKLKVIPEPAAKTRTILVTDKNVRNPEFFIQGKNGTDYLCGNCGAILAQDITDDSKIKGLVMQCKKCNAYNETEITYE
jgi:DNA-directed RNA polymerase subunit RPC12/RpoP